MDKQPSISQINRFPIVDYLRGLGIEPVKVRGNDYWYLSPLRAEKQPSFKVSAKLNLWYDFGLGKGGTLYDLGIHLHGDEQMLRNRLSNVNSFAFSSNPDQKSASESKLEIISISALSSPNLRKYLTSRGISLSAAQHYCKEIEFRIAHNTYLAVGFLNCSGGYELRNSWFKGSSSPKDISLIKTNPKSLRLSVFEGFTDFLSALTLNDIRFKKATTQTDFLVLNSLSFLSREIPLFRSYSGTTLFVDNDAAGKQAKEALKENGISFHDASLWYAPHKDVNEYLIATREVMKAKDNEIDETQDMSRKRSRGMRM